MKCCRYPYRVFISYSHDDRPLAERLRMHLAAMDTRPEMDAAILAGTKFSEEIRRKISNAHIFVSLLTTNSKARPWVHQELGFALGLGLPVLPLALDELPEGMAHEIQALKIAPDLRDLAERLTAETLDEVVARSQHERTAMFECADKLYDRTRLLVEYAKSLLRPPHGPCRIRQRSAFSSFSLPKKNPKHSDWDACDGLSRRDDAVRELLRQERDLMEQHAREAGCDLIIDPFVSAEEGEPLINERRFKHQRAPTIKRSEILKQFIDRMPDDKLRIVVQRGKIDGSMIIIGDWVAAEAVVPHYKGGYKQTIFTRHGPTVLAKIEEFDRDFDELLDDLKLQEISSRQAALRTLDQLMEMTA
jgi:hypothetical protein